MATRSGNLQLEKLQADNKRLRQENDELRKRIATKSGSKSHSDNGNLLTKIGVIVFISLAVSLLVAGNLLFWAGNTIVKTDRYVAATAPIIRNTEVQNALASKISTQLFEKVDINQLTEQVLPPRADFLAPTIADQLEQHTEATVKKILQNPEFQNKWNDAQEHAHERFIQAVEKHGSDGSIDIGEVYSDVSQNFKDTKLAFLADKPLPPQVGKIQLIQGSWLTVLQKTIQNIDTWRMMAIGLLVLFSAAAIWLSRNRRRTVILLASFSAAAMFLTAIAGRLAREVITSHANPQYAEAIRQAYTIFMHPFVTQTFTLFGLALIVAIIAWISGPYASSRNLRSKIDQLLSGQLHAVIFGHHENKFTEWVGKNKQLLQWLSVAVVALSTLFVRLTPTVLLTQVLIILLAVLVIDILAAKPEESTT